MLAEVKLRNGGSRSWTGLWAGVALGICLAAQGAAGAGGAPEPGWAVPYGGEAWRAGTGPAREGSAFAEVRDRVTHALRPAAGKPGKSAKSAKSAKFEYGLRTPTYRADYGADGLRFAPAGQDGPALGLRTESITAGGRAFPLDRGGSWWIRGNTAQRLLSKSLGAVEHHEAGPGGVEVVWYFPRRPAGAERLEVTARLSGLSCGEGQGKGFRCREGKGDARVRIGDVTAVDSRGRTWPLPARIAGNLLRVEVPEEVMAAAVFPLALDPLISPEFQLREPSIAEAYQSSASVASNGTDFLVVWTESYFDNRIWAARVRGDADGGPGTILDPEGIPIAVFNSYQCLPTVTSNGTDFLVTWEDFLGATGSDVFAARIGGSNGLNLDPLPIRISAADGEQTMPKAAASGADYLVVWEDSRSGSLDIYASRLGADGSVRDPSGMPLETDPGDQALPAVASNDGIFLVAWEDYRGENADIRGLRLSASDGAPLGTGAFPVSSGPGDQNRPALASGRDGFLAVWEDYRSITSSDIYGSRISRAPGGEIGDDGVMDSEGIPLGTAANYQLFPAAAFSGGAYLIAWEDYSSGTSSDIRGVRINSLDGSAIEPAVIQAGPGDEYAPALAAKEGRFLAAYQSGNAATGIYRIQGRFAAFDEDRDVDGVFDSRDNCPVHANPDQADLDGDGKGDACDPDDDNDGFPDGGDNCPRLSNGDQLDTDLDGIGDACDGDDDGDAVADAGDNCPIAANPGQEDRDGDGKGDICDPVVEVGIDIKPGSTPNTINLGSGGVVSVAILSGPDFDARRVVPISVTLASAPVRMRGRSGPAFDLRDVNGDGRMDMVVQVSTETMELAYEDHPAELEGLLVDGQAIHGMDLVRVVP